MLNDGSRGFLKTSAAFAGVMPSSLHLPTDVTRAQSEINDDAVSMTADGPHFCPKEYLRLLFRLAVDGRIAADSYSRGGAVEELELACAKLLVKETAVFMPTGTLANHLAVRTLTVTDRRVVVQHDSHLYNDTGDCAQTLSQLNLIPLGKDKVTFTLKDMKRVTKWDL